MSEWNTYQPRDSSPKTVGKRVVFISHRSSDKQVARALSQVVSTLEKSYAGYWS